VQYEDTSPQIHPQPIRPIPRKAPNAKAPKQVRPVRLNRRRHSRPAPLNGVTRNGFVPADFYNHRLTAHTGIPGVEEDHIDLEPTLAVYHEINTMLVYLTANGEMGYKSTLGTQQFIGRKAGNYDNVFVGRPGKVVWGDNEGKEEVRLCEGE
jgi:hypothetical protein